MTGSTPEPQLFHPGGSGLHPLRRAHRRSCSNVISINGGVQLDLMGQENAESAGTRQLSGIGGQMDFLEGRLSAPRAARASSASTRPA